MQYTTPKRLAALLAERDAAGQARPMLVDVREAWEWNLCHIPGSVHVPMHLIPLKMQEFEREREIVCICHTGGRSGQVVQFLQQHGYANAINLLGGVADWADSVDPQMPRY
jgi:rhodanese-related sulfurtransferase